MKTLALCSAVLLATVLTAAGAQATTPPTVLLGTAGQFAVLAGSGITNTGASTITGDVGSSPTPSETGFAGCPAADCVALTGANHTDPSPNDAVTQGAKAALTTAYNDAAGRSPTTVLTELAGQTLVAGVYNSASGTFGMTGTLTLDGANNADSVFIFQTGSTLTTGGTGNVVFIRGAQACNVFWKIGSAATLGAGSKFAGTLMAHDDISLGDGVTVSGRLLAAEQGNAGAVTLIHDTITKPAACIQQSDVDAAAAAATAAAAQAAAASAAAQAAADQAAAAAAAATAAAAAANVEAARVAAVAAAEAARVAQAKADAATAAAAKAAKIAAANAAAVKAKAAARVARQKAQAAKVAAAKAKHSAAVAAAKVALAKKKKAAAGASSVGHARPPIGSVGFTG